VGITTVSVNYVSHKRQQEIDSSNDNKYHLSDGRLFMQALFNKVMGQALTIAWIIAVVN
jgi:hypothetical protein